MRLYLVKYTSSRTNHAIAEELEWATHDSWDQQRAKLEYEARNPGTAVVSIEEVELCPC